MHRVLAAIPEIERPDYAYAIGIGCPDSEADTGESIAYFGMCAQLAIDTMVIAFAEKMQIKIGKLRQEIVRIMFDACCAIAISSTQAIRLDRPAIVEPTLEQTSRMQLLELDGVGCILVFPKYLDCERIWFQHTYYTQRWLIGTRNFVIPKDRARLSMLNVHERVDIGG